MAFKSFIILAAVAYGVANPLRFAARDAPSNIAAGSFTNCTTDLMGWNPELTTNRHLNTVCTLLEAKYVYCVGGGGDACPKPYAVRSGDHCNAIETNEGITAAQLHALNPWLDTNCDLVAGQVLYVGTGSTTATSAAPLFTSSDMKTSTMSALDTSNTAGAPTASSTTAAPMPTSIAPGTWSNCTKYYTVSSGVLRWNPRVDVACDNLGLEEYCVKDAPARTHVFNVASGDCCAKIESNFTLTSTQLYDLNLGLDTACDLEAGENLCVGQIQ
ncbi:hypothetical protein FOMPIDRAFT_89688 [Fomitopsis schrenkii]|uniref:LysM domain-containing protein n=1 Tax=Fomitopsis schrenkii TaxID=2126942 RepID=S8DK75_FOMSC|nr:hypothetical protein FOMPIDRAFT_89688 [Fomitopsis schrenkii]